MKWIVWFFALVLLVVGSVFGWFAGVEMIAGVLFGFACIGLDSRYEWN